MILEIIKNYLKYGDPNTGLVFQINARENVVQIAGTNLLDKEFSTLREGTGLGLMQIDRYVTRILAGRVVRNGVAASSSEQPVLWEMRFEIPEDGLAGLGV